MLSTKDRRSGFSAPLRAAQYVRMSTDHQQFSPVFQRQAIAEYAAAHNIRIVRDYEDAGISGLTLRERPALTQLLVDVESPARKFTIILVYDVSRWGRFQDVDEAAFYEYACRRAGVKVIYVAEPFENDASPATCVMKALKRAMAGEFSREISRKVFLGHCVNVERGYHSGGPPGYGLQRVLVDSQSGTRRPLAQYQYKNLQTDRVVLAPGPPHEVALVRKMFEWYATRRTTATDIARRLNDFGICNGACRLWLPRNILQILRNEKYIGTNVYSRTSSKLDAPWEQLPEAEWIRVAGAFEPVIGAQLFGAVQHKLARIRQTPSRDEILSGLRKVMEKAGELNQATLKRYRSAPSVERVMREFGSLYAAYKEIG
ncbi:MULTISPECIES: recombinase family protein [Paraburkholderia]|uniref:Recombinase family protein n=1 Tax=Paraburkholderia madseniana TaxID=2599607 RepID=A0AAP5BLA4_9BURK|nr:MULTISPECIES: recombinase family protein [Paraburkholderia]MCX4150770.1 recombinase family protein [Paraburkholderia madseniana]MDN7153703.1 recombinase family protein [Paraburkholderia sp. WS6]MDQ6412585.1 recombinase family protein [Paraburkholderia madseniana]